MQADANRRGALIEQSARAAVDQAVSTRTDLHKILNKAGFDIEIQDSLYIDTMLPLTVIKQIPEADELVKSNRTVYLRSPKMVVFKKTDNRGFNYAGVFVCDDKDGNEIWTS